MPPPTAPLLDWICRITLPVIRRETAGPSPQGLRSAGYLGEGDVAGAALSGVVLPGGADWSVIRTDGVMEVDVKFMIRTFDEAMIQVSYDGLVDFGEDGYRRALEGRPPALTPRPRTALRMLASDPGYLWVNRAQFIGDGTIIYAGGAASVLYEVHRIL